jgi:hypothetical protein
MPVNVRLFPTYTDITGTSCLLRYSTASTCYLQLRLVVDLKEGNYVSLCQFQGRMEEFENVSLCLA